MCKITSIEICQTHNHAILKTDTRGDIYLHGSDLNIDFTHTPFNKAYAFILYYIKSVNEQKRAKAAAKEFYKTMKKAVIGHI